MLAKYLKEMRAARVVSASQAVGTLGAGWKEGPNGALEKEFLFDDFMQASNFMQRYADFCSQVNHTPEWSNVYNRVNVRLQNREFDGVTKKEVEIGHYLNTVSQATLNIDVEEEMSLEKLTAAAGVQVESLLNN